MGLFGALKYDLAHNKINYLEIESLKHLSLTLFIEKLCRDGFITNYIIKNIEKIKGNKGTDKFTIANELAEILTKKNIFESVYFSSSYLNRFRTFIKETVCFIVIQIYDLLRKETIAKDEEKNVSLLMRNLNVTRQGTIDLKRTVHRILRREQLFPSHSCELACYYFITDEIVNNHYEMVINEDRDYFVGHDKEEAVKGCLAFWKWFILNFDKDNLKLALQDPEEMKKMTVSVLINDEKSKFISNMFEKTVSSNNEIAVYYLWNTYVSKVKEQKIILRNALRISILYSSHTNINMFLLFHLDSNELDKRFKYNYFGILTNIVRNVRWHFLFAMALNELQTYLSLYYYELLLGTLTDSHFIDFTSQINITIEYIISFQDKIKEIVLRKPTYIYEQALIKPFTYAKKNLVTSLLSLCNEFENKEFLLTMSGTDLFAEAIKRGNLEFVKEFLLEYFEREDILAIKNNFYYWKSEIMYDHFIEVRQFQKLSDVIDWMSEGIPESLHHFNDRMLSQNNGLFLKQMIFIPNVDSDIDPLSGFEFISWCFKTDESDSLFKRKIILCPNETLTGTQNLITCYDELINLILESKWKLLEKFFNWRNFVLNEKLTFHQKLFNDDTFLSQVILKVRNDESFLELFTNFLKTHLALLSTDMNNFRRRILNAIVKEYPEIEIFLMCWFENEISKDELLVFSGKTGKVFKDWDILNWLNPQDNIP